MFRNKKKEKELSFLKGCFQDKDYMAPSYINLQNPKYIEIDGCYFCTLLAVNYEREYQDILWKDLLNKNMNMNISVFYEKQDSYKIIKDLTYYIGNSKVDLEKKKNYQDRDIIAFSYEDAKYIRKQIQVDNQELYFLYIYYTLYSKDVKELEYSLLKIESLLKGNGIQTKRAYFRQEPAFISCLPVMQNKPEVKQVARRNVLTNGLVATYPFICSNIFDENGIFIGTNLYNNSLLFFDKYNSDKYKNANICILGTSGAGKSFFTKLLILRNHLLGMKQYVVDPDREYENLGRNIGGTVIKIGPNFSTFINILEIRPVNKEEKGVLSVKINKLIGFFRLLWEDMNSEQEAILEEKLILCYQEKGITFQEESLYKEIIQENQTRKVFKTAQDMPILEDLIPFLEQDKQMQILKTKLMPFINGSMQFFNHYTNVNLQNNLIVADIYDLGEENLKYGMYVLTELFWEKIKEDRSQKKTIYLDEVWRLIGATSNKIIASFVHKMFKTIRKYGGSAVAITQDIEDLFSLENGIYGKSIINNSSSKILFALEEENIELISNCIKLSEKEKREIQTLKKAEALMLIEQNHFLTKIQCSNKEMELIEGGEIEKINNSNRRSHFS